MKQFSMFIVLALCMSGLSAQTLHNSLRFHVGPAFPLGKFAKMSLTDKNAGNANNGLSYELSFRHGFTKFLGLQLTWQGNYNKLNAAETLKNLSSLTNSPWKADLAYWRSSAGLLGIYFHKEIAEKIFLDAAFLGGVLRLKTDMTHFETDSPPNTWLSTSDASAMNTAFNIAAGLSWSFHPKFDMIFNTAYTQTKVTIKDILVDGSGGIKSRYDKTQPYKVFCSTVGLGFKF
jgi:hypothetical protein